MSYLAQLHLPPSSEGEEQRTKNDQELLLLFENDLIKCSNEAIKARIPHYMAIYHELENTPTYSVSASTIDWCMYVLCALFVHGAMTGAIRNYTKEQVGIMVPTFLDIKPNRYPEFNGHETEFVKLKPQIQRWHTMGEAVHDILLGNRAFDDSSDAATLNEPHKTQDGEDLISIRLACVNFEKYKKRPPTYTYAACKAEVQAILEGEERPPDTKYDVSKRWVRKQHTGGPVEVLGRVISDKLFIDAVAKLSSYIRNQ